MKHVREEVEEERNSMKRLLEEEEKERNSMMKRAREEEKEEVVVVVEEEEEEEEQAAPMVSSPTPNPPWGTRGPAVAETTSGTAERRVITKYDVVDFMMSVKCTFERAKYCEFLDIILQRNSIGVRGIADRMKVLLRGYPDLKRRFNMFLPTEYELSLGDDD